MAILLQIVGFIWAALGVANIAMRDWQDPSAAAVTGTVVIFNMVLFIIPGLLLGGLGHSMQKKQQAKPAAAASTTKDRLAELERLHREGLLNQAEYDAKRQEILKQL